MRGKIVEVTASGNVRLYTPGKIFTVIVQIAWWLCETYLYIDNVTDRTVFYKLLLFGSTGDNVGSKQRNKECLFLAKYG